MTAWYELDEALPWQGPLTEAEQAEVDRITAFRARMAGPLPERPYAAQERERDACREHEAQQALEAAAAVVQAELDRTVAEMNEWLDSLGAGPSDQEIAENRRDAVEADWADLGEDDREGVADYLRQHPEIDTPEARRYRELAEQEVVASATPFPFDQPGSPVSARDEWLSEVTGEHVGKAPGTSADGVSFPEIPVKLAEMVRDEKMRLKARDIAKTEYEQERSGSTAERPLYIDAAALLDGDLQQPLPGVGSRRRGDGWQLLYENAVNVLVGDPEAGKSLLATAMVIDALHDGLNALWIDLDHNGAEATIARLRRFGLRDDILTDPARFRLAIPETPDEVDRMVAEAAGWAPGIVVVDSIGELIPLFGGNSNDADEYTAINRRVNTALASTGAAVLAIDHLAKNSASRDYGSTGTVAKKRAVDGVMLRVSVAEAFTPGTGGASILTVLKDRHGGVRKLALPGAEPRVAIFSLDDVGSRATWELYEPRSDADRLAGDVHELAQLDPAPTSQRDVKERLGWGSTRALNALKAWREAGGASAPGALPEHEEH